MEEFREAALNFNIKFLELNKEYVRPKFIDEDAPTLAVYTQFTPIQWRNYPDLAVVLCPCTNYDHLKPIPNGIDVIYLDDPKFLYNRVFSAAEHVVQQLLSLVKMNRLQLTGSNIGIIGMGRIGQQVTKMLLGFNPDIRYYDVKEEVKFFDEDLGQMVERVDLDTLFKKSNTVIISATANDKSIVTKEHMDLINGGVILINVSRGINLDADVLLYGVNKDKIIAASLDVVDSYTDKQLAELKAAEHERDIYLTSHLAGKALPARYITDMYVFKKLVGWAEARNLIKGVPNHEAFKH